MATRATELPDLLVMGLYYWHIWPEVRRDGKPAELLSAFMFPLVHIAQGRHCFIKHLWIAFVWGVVCIAQFSENYLCRIIGLYCVCKCIRIACGYVCVCTCVRVHVCASLSFVKHTWDGIVLILYHRPCVSTAQVTSSLTSATSYCAVTNPCHRKCLRDAWPST